MYSFSFLEGSIFSGCPPISTLFSVLLAIKESEAVLSNRELSLLLISLLVRLGASAIISSPTSSCGLAFFKGTFLPRSTLLAADFGGVTSMSGTSLDRWILANHCRTFLKNSSKLEAVSTGLSFLLSPCGLELGLFFEAPPISRRDTGGLGVTSELAECVTELITWITTSLFSFFDSESNNLGKPMTAMRSNKLAPKRRCLDFWTSRSSKAWVSSKTLLALDLARNDGSWRCARVSGLFFWKKVGNEIIILFWMSTMNSS